LGKKAKDFIEKGFPLGILKFNHKIKTPHSIDVDTELSHSLESSVLDASTTLKYSLPQHGITISEKVNNKNTLVATLEIQPKLIKGLKKTVEVKFDPTTGKQSALVKAAYAGKWVNLSTDVNFLSSCPVVTSAIVFGCPKLDKTYLLGVQVGYDALSHSVNKYELSLAYHVKDFQLFGSVRNHSEFVASAYQRCSDRIETGLQVAYDHATHGSNFSLAGKYDINKDVFLKAKVDSNSLLNIAYGFALQQGVKLTLGGSLDGKNWNAGNHRVGLQLELES